MNPKKYNVHGILKIRINTKSRSLLKGLNFPLTYFEVNDVLDDPDIILNIGKFKPSNNDCYLVDHKYYIKENYFYCKDSEGKAKWEVEIIGFEKPPTVINFNGKVRGMYRYLAPDLLPQDNIFLPIIELFLGMNGFFLAHGGGIVKEDEAIIFLGRSGSLKTTIIMNAIKKNLKILGDDRLILNTKDNKIYSFPIHPKILEYIIENSDDENINIFKKALLVRHLMKEESPNTHVWQSEPVNLKSVYLLKMKSTENNEMEIHPITKDIAVQKIIANNKAEIYGSSIPSVKKRNFMLYMIAYSFIFPDSRIATYWDNLVKVLREMLRNMPIYEIELPRQYSLNISEKLNTLIREME